MATRDDGSIEISSNTDTHLLLSRNGSIQETAQKKVTTANRVDIVADEISINHHILNNKLYDLTDFKQVTTGDFQTGIVGNFTVLGTVLTKSWEPDLKRYVFIRRLARIPLFSPAVKPPEVKTGMGLNDITKATVDLVGVMNKQEAAGQDASTQVQAATDKINSDPGDKKYEANGKAPNGLYYEDNDIAYLTKQMMDADKNLKEEDAKKKAVEILSKNPKYTTDLTAPNGTKYKQKDIDKLINGGFTFDEAIHQLSQTDKYRKISIKAQNGVKYSQNDINYLLDNGYSMSDAITLLSQTDKYRSTKKKAPNEKAYDQNDIDYLMNNGYSMSDALSILDKNDKYRNIKTIKAPNGKKYTENDIVYLTNRGCSIDEAVNILSTNDKYKKKSKS